MKRFEKLKETKNIEEFIEVWGEYTLPCKTYKGCKKEKWDCSCCMKKHLEEEVANDKM